MFMSSVSYLVFNEYVVGFDSVELSILLRAIARFFSFIAIKDESITLCGGERVNVF